MKTAIVLGMGEVGEPIYDMLCTAYGHSEITAHDPGIDQYDRGIEILTQVEKREFIHICFPQTERFVEHVVNYVKKLEPKCVFIHSTLTPGMTNHLCQFIMTLPESPALVYSPVRGNIRDGMSWGLKNYTKYFSYKEYRHGIRTDNFELIENHLKGMGFKTEYVKDVESLEWAKIFDLGLYGLNIAYYQELERIVTDNALDYSTIRKFIETTPHESDGRAQRVVHYGGFIGGHCVMQAIDKILSLKDIPILKAVVDSNRMRERELTFDPEECIGKDWPRR